MLKFSKFIHGLLVVYLLAIGRLHGFLDTPNELPKSTSTTLPSLAEPPLRIASFNIQVFGQTKYQKLNVRNALVKILSRYDIVQVLEIRDSRGTVFEALCNDLNTYMRSVGENVTYSHIESGRLGRTASKEQYGFLYRTNFLSLVDSYQMTDLRDDFEREPFGARFSSPTTVLKDFGMVALHIQPSNVLTEINQLPNIYRTFRGHWNIKDILISGDFNADCNYLTQSRWENVTTRDDPDYDWLLDDRIDTTVAPSCCGYDKFVATGQFANNVVPGSVKAYRFDEVMNLNKSEGRRISDHYPIELQLKGSSHTAMQQHLESKTSFVVKDNKNVSNINNIRRIYRKPSCVPTGFVAKLQREETHMDFVTATMTSLNDNDVMTKLMAFNANCTGTLSANLLGMVNGYMQANYLINNTPQVYGLVQSKTHSYEIVIKCWLVSPNVCEVTVSYTIGGGP